MSDGASSDAKGSAPKRTYQPTFAAGELAPALHWRSDLAKWRAGAASMVNFIVTAQGGAARRAGTQFVTRAKDDSGQQRLLSFQFSTEQQYVLELGDGYMRFITGGAYVMNGGSPYEISTPYAAAELFGLRFVQSADVLTIVHVSHQPRELRRYGALDWRLVTIAVGTTLTAPTGLTATATFDTAVTGSPAPTAHTFTYAVSGSSNATHDEGPISGPASCSNLDLGYFNQYGYRNELAWDALAGADFYTVYRQYQGVWAKLGSTTDLSFVDQNFIPDTGTGPPVGFDPFTGTNWPGTVGYFQERRVFAGSAQAPETIWMSRTGNYRNFDVSDPVKDDDGITYTLAARQVNQVRHLLPLADLIVMTGGGGWKVGASGGAITPGNIDVAPQSFVGASEVPPIIIGNRILFVEAAGSTVREIAYQFVQNQYVSEDRSVFAAHLLRGHWIVAWAYAEQPDKVLWIVREDGVLLSLTYLVEQEVFAWAKHTTNGQWKAVTVIRETLDTNLAEDVPYFVVQRGGRTMIERMHSRLLGADNNDTTLAWHVDCGLRHRGSPISHVSGLDHLADGTSVAFLADGTPGVATLAGGGFDLPAAASIVVAGLEIPSSVTTLPVDGPQPMADPWLGRKKHGFRARVAVENAAGLVVSIDGADTAGLVDPDTGVDPGPALVTGVLEARTTEGWARQGRITFATNSPMAATILGVATEWQVGE